MSDFNRYECPKCFKGWTQEISASLASGDGKLSQTLCEYCVEV